MNNNCLFSVNSFKRYLNEHNLENSLKEIIFLPLNQINKDLKQDSLENNLAYSLDLKEMVLYISPKDNDVISLDFDCDYLFAFMPELESVDVLNLDIDTSNVMSLTELFSNCSKLKTLGFLKYLYPAMNNTYNYPLEKMGLLSGCNSISKEEIENNYLVNNLNIFNKTEDGKYVIKIDKYSLNRYISFRDLDKSIEVINFGFNKNNNDINNLDNISKIEDIFIKAWHDKEKKTLYISQISEKIRISLEDNVSELFLSFNNLKQINGIDNVIGFEDFLFDNLDIK